MPVVTMRCGTDAPISWVAAESFNMEHAATLVSIGQHQWPEVTQPRTTHPIRIGKLATCGVVITYRR